MQELSQNAAENGKSLQLEANPQSKGSHLDNGSLTYLFKDYIDNGIREPIVDFGSAVEY